MRRAVKFQFSAQIDIGKLLKKCTKFGEGDVPPVLLCFPLHIGWSKLSRVGVGFVTTSARDSQTRKVPQIGKLKIWVIACHQDMN